MASLFFEQYDFTSCYDEVFAPNGIPRPHYRTIVERFTSYTPSEFNRRRALAELTFRYQGITFTVYGDETGVERIFPFDLFPRVIPASEWAQIEAGLIQRVTALNAFLHDIYHEAEILQAGVIPRRLIEGKPLFRPEVRGITLPYNVYTHI
ncbi:MAG: circularly permuted type 2 ATP-grasp protein, partial [Nitrospinota bacterium]